MREATCDGCKRFMWVNLSYGNKVTPKGDYCADCYEQFALGAAVRHFGKESPCDAGPEWDNVVRASEEDR